MTRFSVDKDEFLRLIVEDANLGRTFVPFIGSGLSSPSGIIMGMEFTNYLAFTMYLVLCNPKTRKPTHGEGQAERWNLMVQGWPPLPSRSEVATAKKWIADEFDRLCTEFGLRKSFDGDGQIQSLAQDHKSAVDDFVMAMIQPPIPMILRSWLATADQERLRQLRSMLMAGAVKSRQRFSPSWKRSHQSFHDVVTEAGIRALSDWRETLEFLSKLTVTEQGLSLDEPNPSIIDDFNTTITRDKRASLGHKVLAHLSEPLRIATLLTTNFDTLTEDAYHALSIPLTVLPVSARGELPNPRTAGSCDSLIKLHGESHDTRADLSLDDEPSEEDKATFLAYMQRGTGHLLHQKQSVNTLPNRTSRLLVVGYSGNDHRCVQMIKYWLEHSDDQPRAYWVCFSESDQEKVDRLFRSASFDGQIKTVLTSRPDLLLYDLYQKLQLSLPPGGLTYEFTHVLPPDRAELYDHDETKVAEVLAESKKSASHAGLIAKHSKRLMRDAIVRGCFESILMAVDSTGNPSSESTLINKVHWQPYYRIDENLSDAAKRIEIANREVVHSPNVISCSGGVVRASAIATNKLAHKHNNKVFWIELQDYLDTDSLLRDFLRTLALRCGHFQSMHVTLHPISAGFALSDVDSYIENFLSRLVSHIRAVLDEYRVDPKSVVVFLTGRDSYGIAAGLVTLAWSSEEFRRLHVLIEALARVGIPTVYFPCSNERAKRKLNLIQSAVVNKCIRSEYYGLAEGIGPMDTLWPSDHLAEKLLNKGTSRNAESIANELSVFGEILTNALNEFYDISQTGNGSLSFSLKPYLPADLIRKLEFIYSLTLFRHSRHANAISAEGAFPCPYRFQNKAVDNDFVRSIQVNKWLGELCKARLFFTKPGGAYWMHRDIREAMQSILERTDLTQLSAPVRKNACFRATRARKHFWIGDWYQKAFLSSGHITPVIESIYHLLSSAIYSPYAEPKRTSYDWNTGSQTPEEKSELVSYRSMMFESAVMQASKCLLLSWRYVELWQASSANVAWLSSTHSNAIEKLLRTAIEKCDPDKQHRDKLDLSIRHFCNIHKALGEAVALEGGKSERSTTTWSAPECIVMRLFEKGDQSPTASVAHGIDAIRVGDDTKFWDSLEQQVASQDKTLWNKLVDAGQGRIELDQFGSVKATWKTKANTTDLQTSIWFLGEAAYVLLRRAKLKFHANGRIDSTTWLVSTVCCNLGIDLCKHLPAWNLEYEVSSKIKMHSIYAVGLANLGRFYEANRHLNEAQGLLSKWQRGTSVDHAVISIRRAEVKLTECFWISCLLGQINVSNAGIVTVPALDKQFAMPSLSVGAVNCWELDELDKTIKSLSGSAKLMPPKIFEAFRITRPANFDSNSKEQCDDWIKGAQVILKNMYSSVLDEAVRSLEIAEKSIGGASQSSLWWSRLRTLRLRVYGLLDKLPEDARFCIVFRKQSADNGIFKNFLAAKRIAGEDDFRRLRALKYFLSANKWYCGYRGKDPSSPVDRLTFLPDSIRAAHDLSVELWDRNETCDDSDLLKTALVNCFNEFSEIDPR
jgi:hypothetical protein